MIINLKHFMKKIGIILIAFIGILASSCGPSAEELKRQKEIEDSIAKVERETAIDKASQLLEAADSIADSTAIDTIIPNEE